MSDPEREAVWREAESWLRTPYHGHGRLKGIGVDCAQFPILVYNTVGLIPLLEPEYSDQWHVHFDREVFVEWVLKYAREVASAEAAGLGGLGVWKFGRAYSHGAILGPGSQVIHAKFLENVQLGDRLRDLDFADRPGRFFTLWGG